MNGKIKGFLFFFFCISLFSLEAEVRIFPDIKVTYGTDAFFRNTLTTSELFVNQPFYLLIEVSGTLEVSGIHRLLPQPESFSCYIIFTSNDSPLINISLVEANTPVSLQTPRVVDFFEWFYSRGGNFQEMTGEEREEYTLRSNELTREELTWHRTGTRFSPIKERDAYYAYGVSVSLRPRGNVTRLILRIDPLQAGTQEIIIRSGEDLFNYQVYRFSILP